MANNKSSKKRIRLNKRNYIINKYYKTSAKNLIKVFIAKLKVSQNFPLNLEEKEILKKKLNSIYSILDRGVKKHIFHKNTVARKKSKLTISFQKLSKI